MSILLLNGLPEEYEGIPISADYRNMIQVDLILHDPTINETEKIIAALYQLYPDLPGDVGKAVEGLVWFYTRGDTAGDSKDRGAKKAPKKAFDFEQDANLIYAAFYATYGISLTTVDFLHWWEFMALLEGLPETTLMQRVIYWRTVDVNGLSKHEKKHVLKMRKLFALKGQEKPALDIEELNRRTRDRVARRFAEAEEAMKNKGD